jgi:hypothetical protein
MGRCAAAPPRPQRAGAVQALAAEFSEQQIYRIGQRPASGVEPPPFCMGFCAAPERWLTLTAFPSPFWRRAADHYLGKEIAQASRASFPLSLPPVPGWIFSLLFIIYLSITCERNCTRAPGRSRS